MCLDYFTLLMVTLHANYRSEKLYQEMHNNRWRITLFKRSMIHKNLVTNIIRIILGGLRLLLLFRFLRQIQFTTLKTTENNNILSKCLIHIYMQWKLSFTRMVKYIPRLFTKSCQINWIYTWEKLLFIFQLRIYRR